MCVSLSPQAAASAHASTHVALADGGFLVAWFGGTAEGAADVAIWAARRAPLGAGQAVGGGSSPHPWSAPRVIAKVSDEAHWNPVLFFVGPVLHVHFKVGDDIGSWRTYASTSADEGATWSSPRELVPGDRGGRGCVKNKPLMMPPPPEVGGGGEGVLLCGASTEAQDTGWRAFVDVSTDGGRSFERTKDVHVVYHAHYPGAGVIQPALWRTPAREGAVHMLLRSDAGAVYRADSTDGGRTWGPARRTSLGNNNAGLDVAPVLGGSLLALAYNPGSKNWGARYPLRVSLSADDGQTWGQHVDLETAPGEFSYPAITPWPEGEAGGGAKGFTLTYTYNRRNVKFVSMSVKELIRRAKEQEARARVGGRRE